MKVLHEISNFDPFSLGIGVLAVLVLLIGPEEVLNAMEMANPWYVVLAFLIQFCSSVFWTERWSINIRVVNIKIKKLTLLPILLVGMAVNNITPSARGGGGTSKGYIL